MQDDRRGETLALQRRTRHAEMMVHINTSAEFRFVCACCRGPADAARASTVVATGRTVNDWRRVLAIAQRHRVIGLVADAVRQYVVAPPEVVEALNAAGQVIAANNLRQVAETIRLDRRLAEVGVRPLILKGSPLGVLAYGSLVLKHSNDIDLVIAPAALPAAVAILDEAGYLRVTPDPSLPPEALMAWFDHAKEASWRHREHGTHIELHGRLFSNPALMPNLSWRSPRQSVALQTDMMVETLAPSELYAYLTAHGAMHGWARLKWLADVTALIRAGSLSIDELHAVAETMGAGRCSAQALVLSEALLGLELPATLTAKFHSNHRVNRLVRIAIASMTGRYEAEESNSPTGTPLAVSCSHFLLRSGLRYKWQELRSKSANPSDRARWAGRRWLSAIAPAIGGTRWIARNIGLIPGRSTLAQQSRER